MNSNIGLPILIGAVVITALLAGGIAYMVGSQTATPVAAVAPAPIPAIPAPAPVAPGVVDPNTPRVIVIDRNAILSLSSAGLAMLEDVETLTQAADREFQAQANDLQEEATTLQQELAILAPDIRTQRQQEFQNRQTAQPTMNAQASTFSARLLSLIVIMFSGVLWNRRNGRAIP